MAVGRQFGRETLIYLGGFVGAGIIQFVAVPVYARVLGPADFGLLTLTIATTTALAGVMVLGGDVALARFWPEAQSEDDKRALASTWITFLTGWSVLVALAGCAAAPWVAHRMQAEARFAPLLIVGVLGIVPTQLSSMLAQILRNQFRPIPYAVSTVLIMAVNVTLGITLAVVLELGVFGIVLGTLIGQTIGCLMRTPLVRASLGRPLHWASLPPLLRFGVAYVPTSLAVWGFTGVDRLIIGALGTRDEVGAYGLAAMLIGPFTVLTLSVGQAWIPRITAIHAVDPARARVIVSSAIEIALSSLGMAAILLGALAPWLIVLVGGSEYEDGAAALPFLALAAAFSGTVLFTATGLTLAKRTGVLSAATIAAALCNVGLLVILVPAWGVVGAALAVSAAYLILAILTLLAANAVAPMRLPVLRWGGIVALLIGQSSLSTLRPSTGWVLLSVVASSAALGLVGRRKWIDARQPSSGR